MKLERYNHADGFDLPELRAVLDFKTATSASFSLGRHAPLRLGPTGDPGMDRLHKQFNQTTSFDAFRVLGHLDVHHPCEGHIKTQLRVALPDDYVARIHRDVSVGQLLVTAILTALGIPHDETFEALFFSAHEQISIVECVDRDGMTNII